MFFRRAPAALVVGVCLMALLFAASAAAAPFRQGGSFVFSAAGDFGSNANTTGVLTAIAGSGAQFHLALGDLSYGSMTPESAWCDYVKSKVGAAFPFELISGNHEMDGQGAGNYINNFVTCLPDRLGGLTGVYAKQYYFDYQNLVRFIQIAPNLTLDGETYAYTVGSTRYNWLVSAIDGARATNMPWVVVSMHKNCISTGVKSCEIGADLLNLLVSKKVDLVLQGHDHNYQRAKQLAFTAGCSAIVPNQYNASCVNDDGLDQYYPRGGGMVLTVVGTGGASLYGSSVSDSEAGYFARIATTGVDTPSYGFMKFTVNATQLNGQFVTTTAGATFTDSFQIGGAAPPTLTPSPTPNNTTLIAKNSAWKYLANGTNQGTAWREKDFDDSAWASGNGQLGYGDGDESTLIGYGPNVNSKYVTTYFRKAFSITSPAAVSALQLHLLRDDGAVVYLNGTQVASSNMPASFGYTTFASSVVGDADESTYFPFSLSTAPLQALQERVQAVQGVNVLAVEVHQANATSSDVSFDAELVSTNAPTAISLSSFTARLNRKGKAVLRWQTAGEVNLIGFNVTRSAKATRGFQNRNPDLIPAKQLGQAIGATYRFKDSQAAAGKTYYYRLELVHADDAREWSDVVRLKIP